MKQLELLLTRQTDVELFQDARMDFLVFDEAHTFTGAQGTETACLIRCLRHFVRRDSSQTVCIGTSATIADLDDILTHPCLLSQVAERLGEKQKRIVTPEELLFWVTLGAEARQQGRALLRPVVHGFLRGIGGAGVAWLPLATCTTCGQHNFHTWLQDFRFIQRVHWA